MRVFLLPMVAALSVLMAGCQSASTNQTELAKLAGLQEKVDALQQELATIRQQQKATSSEVFGLKFAVKSHDAASFDPISSPGYQLLDLGIGRVMVSIEDIAPYADGARVKLAIGNPNSVTFDGAEGTVSYGTSSDVLSKGIDFETWEKGQKTIPISLPEPIMPARWNIATITLPGVKIEELGRLEITLKGNKVRLYK